MSFDLKLDPFIPHPALAHGHTQTLLGHLLPSEKLAHRYERHEISCPDGDRIVVRIVKGASPVAVSLFHGLAGSAESPYMNRIANLMVERGHTVIVVNHRGCGDGQGLAVHPYHSGKAEDLSTVIGYGRKNLKAGIHVAIGFSLSGNALLSLVSEMRGNVKPDAAIAVNAPIQLDRASKLLGQGFNRVYSFRFIRDLKREIAEKPVHHQKAPPISRFASMQTFDSLYTAPRAGFNSRDHYYSECSTAGHLHRIRVPTVILTAKDDPFVSFDDYARAKLSDHVHLHAENHGGHMGYISSKPTELGNRRWMDYAVDQSLKALLKAQL